MKYKKTSLLTTAFLITLCIGIIPQIANAESFCIAQVSEEQSTNNTSQLPIIVSTPQVITTTVDVPHPPSDIPQPTNEIFQAVAESPQPTNDISQPSAISHFQNTAAVDSGQWTMDSGSSFLSSSSSSGSSSLNNSSNSNNSPLASNPQPSAAIALAPKEIAEDVTTSVSKKIEAMNERLSKFKIKPRAGAYVPFGKDLELSYLGGVDIVRSLNSIVDVRLGVEYSKPGIKNGSDLEIFKVPFMLVENQNKPKLWGFKKLFYTGIGVVYMSAKYNNRQTEGVGGTFLMGRKFGNFAAEFKFDAMRKKPGYQFGGVSIYLNYTY